MNKKEYQKQYQKIYYQKNKKKIENYYKNRYKEKVELEKYGKEWKKLSDEEQLGILNSLSKELLYEDKKEVEEI